MKLSNGAFRCNRPILFTDTVWYFQMTLLDAMSYSRILCVTGAMHYYVLLLLLDSTWYFQMQCGSVVSYYQMSCGILRCSVALLRAVTYFHMLSDTFRCRVLLSHAIWYFRKQGGTLAHSVLLDSSRGVERLLSCVVLTSWEARHQACTLEGFVSQPDSSFTHC